MKFALFGGALAFGAMAHSWTSTNSKVKAYGLESRGQRGALHHTFGSAQAAKVFDHNFRAFKLGEIINIAEDVAIFRFLTPNEEDVFNLAPCSTLQACFKTGTNIVEQVQRFYTPITLNGTQGYFDLVVKKQPHGRMTEHLYAMEVGESLLFRMVQYKMKYKPNKWRHVGLIGGGTGLTSLLQVLLEGLRIPEDKTRFSMLFANQTDRKILLQGLLDKLAAEHSDRFDVNYTVDRSEEPNSWKGYVGHISEKMIRDHMPAPADDIIVLICGPDGMMADLCGAPFAVLKEMSSGKPWQPAGANLNNNADVEGVMGRMGYLKDHVYRF